MKSHVRESKHAYSGKGLSNTEHGNPNIIDEKNSEDHRNNVHHNASLEKVCELEADSVKKTIAFSGIATRGNSPEKHPGFWVR